MQFNQAIGIEEEPVAGAHLNFRHREGGIRKGTDDIAFLRDHGKFVLLLL